MKFRISEKTFNSVFHNLAGLLVIFGFVLLLPIIPVFIYGEYELLLCFLFPSALTFLSGFFLLWRTEKSTVESPSGLLLCGLGWISLSLFGSLPYMVGINASFINAFFESASGFTTTGITVFSGLESFPRSILLWRSLTQWIGGLGIITFFLFIIFRGGGFTFRLFNAETHKISSRRPTPSIFKTVNILWLIYITFTLLEIAALSMAGMSLFDAVNHAFTTISTGGFSPHDASIGFYSSEGYPHFILIEYLIIFFMLLGGTNFLIHFQILKGHLSSLWEDIEIKYYIAILGFGVLTILTGVAFSGSPFSFFIDIEAHFRTALFTATAILTTTGYGTVDINNPYFPVIAKQILLLFMVIGGCVGSTGGGIKIMRVIIIWRVFKKEVINLVTPGKITRNIVIDKEIFPYSEVRRALGIFSGWTIFLIVGGVITAFLTNHDPWSAFSGMFSAMGNIGPCFMLPEEMIALPGGVKIVYIFGMLAGRLEILPVILLFIPKSWR